MKVKFAFTLAMLMTASTLHAQWNLNGNAIASTNFLGSTNAQPLVFKVNNSRSGLIDYDDTKGNTAFGYQSLLNTTGGGNTAVGFLSSLANTTGTNNVAYGYISLYRNTTGSSNTAVGVASLWANTSGQANVAVGFGALNNSTTANNNIATGFKSLFNNTTGTSNSAFGYEALYSNTSVNSLTAVGYQSLYANTSGTFNAATGYRTLYSNTTGAKNTGHGYQALLSNTVGNSNSAFGSWALNDNTGSGNTAVGADALLSNTSGDGNTGTGNGALSNNLTGDYNSGSGFQALVNNQIGHNNTGFGAYALWTNASGSNNTGLGYDADVSTPNLSNATAIGYGTTVNASNKIRFGNASVTVIEGTVAYTVSDRRFKKDIREGVKGLEFIKKLHPVIYKYEAKKYDEFTMKNFKKERRDSILSSLDYRITESIQKSGFIAQEVEQAAKETGYDFDGVHHPNDDNDNYSLSYASFVVPLVKAVQELSSQNDSLTIQNKQMQSQLASLIKRMNDIELMQKQCCNNSLLPNNINAIEATTASPARLDQNTPNPFNSNTVIRYYIPERVTSSQLVVTDLSGRVVKTIPLSNKGNGQTTITAGSLTAGNYLYTLIIDGKKTESRQMILTK